MAIARGEIIAARDVRNKILAIVDDMYSKMDGYVSPTSFLSSNLPSDIVNAINEDYLATFLSNFNLLKNTIGKLSTDYLVSEGKIIALDGFYNYAVSAFCMASNIRHATYNVITRAGGDYNYIARNSVSYLNDFPEDTYLKNTPILSSKITPSGSPNVRTYIASDAFGPNTVRIGSNDFRFNHSETGQEVLSTISYYSDYNIAGHSDLTNLVNYSNFRDSSKPLSVEQIISADHANGLFDILSAINVHVGNIISCEYWWIEPGSGTLEPDLPPSRKPLRFKIEYYETPSSTIPLKTDVVSEFELYRFKTFAEVKPEDSRNVTNWIQKDNSNMKIAPNTQARILATGNRWGWNPDFSLKLYPEFGYSNFLVQFENVDDMKYRDQDDSTTTKPFVFPTISSPISSRESLSSQNCIPSTPGTRIPIKPTPPPGYHYVYSCNVIDTAGLTVKTEGNIQSIPDGQQTFVIGGIPNGVSRIRFNKVCLWVNELGHSHKWSVYLKDINNNNSTRLLIRYPYTNGDYVPAYAYQTAIHTTYNQSEYAKYMGTQEDPCVIDQIYYDVITSTFTDITLTVIGGQAKFQIYSEFSAGGNIWGGIGAREIYFKPTRISDKNIDGGFKGITFIS